MRDARRLLWRAATVLLLGALGYVLWRELARNWASLQGFQLVLSPAPLALAVALALIAFLLETWCWQRALNVHAEQPPLGFLESVAMVNASGLLKYLPGRVWTYGAQMVWLGRRGTSKSLVAYVNLLCMLCSMLVSSLLGSIYVVLYVLPAVWRWPAALAVGVGFVTVLLTGPRLIAQLVQLVQRLAKRELAVVATPLRVMLELTASYVLSWSLLGVAGYFSAQGVGLSVTPLQIAGITAAMSVGWIVGYLAALTPGGLGVREGTMIVMLGRVASSQAALVLPLVSRLLYLVVELGLGLLAIALGHRLRVFSPREPSAERSG